MQSSSMGAEGPRTSRERSGRKSADGTTPEHTQHQAQGGESGAEVRYRYTNKKSERSPYIAERAKLAHNLTEREILQLQYQNREGATVPYQKSDLRYDTQQGYLQITGGSQLEGGRAPTERRTGTQPRREAKDGSKNRAAGRLTAESARTSRSSPGSSSGERQGHSTTQPQQRPRTRRQAHQATHTEAQRPAPDISKKMRPKNGDKEG